MVGNRKAYSVTEVCLLASISRTAFYAAVKTKKLTARKLGTRTVVLQEDLTAWLEALPKLET
jgi:excisionase family DNA binding protein